MSCCILQLYNKYVHLISKSLHIFTLYLYQQNDRQTDRPRDIQRHRHTLSHPKNDRDITERARGVHAAGRILYVSIPMFLFWTWENTHVMHAITSVPRGTRCKTHPLWVYPDVPFLNVRKYTCNARDNKRFPPEYALTSQAFLKEEKIIIQSFSTSQYWLILLARTKPFEYI